MKIHKTGGKVAKWDQDCQVVGQHCQVLFLAKTPLIAAYFVNIAKIAKSLRAGSLRFTTVDTEYRRGTRRFFNHDGTTNPQIAQINAD